jgi:hypothetical protein
MTDKLSGDNKWLLMRHDDLGWIGVWDVPFYQTVQRRNQHHGWRVLAESGSQDELMALRKLIKVANE